MPKRNSRCGACGDEGHNRKNCPRPNLDRYFETLNGGRIRTATPLSPLVALAAVVRYVPGEIDFDNC